MYEFFRGAVAFLDNDGNCCIDVNGVGYRLRVSEATRAVLPLDGSPVTLHARLVVREDEHLLFGFHDPAERAAFDLLTGVTGVGPAVAMAVLSHLGVDELRRALVARDAPSLKKVKGVGAKSAERLVLELHDKVERIPGAAPMTNPPAGSVDPDVARRDDARRALIALGFSVRESEQAVAALDPADTSEAYVRAALAHMRSA